MLLSTLESGDEVRQSAVGTEDREHLVARMFVELADTLVASFDITDFSGKLAERSVELLEVSAAGVILTGPDRGLQVAAASTRRAELLELFAVQTDAGPCIDCVRSGAPVASADLTLQTQRWPRFAVAADEFGFRAVQAVPMRLRDEVVGVLSLLGTEPGAMEPKQVRLGQAMADVASIAILQNRAIEHGDLITGQLQTALTSRVVIEQAKGVLAARGSVDMQDAFTLLRGYARAHNLRLTELARSVVDGTVDLSAILRPGREASGLPFDRA